MDPNVVEVPHKDAYTKEDLERSLHLLIPLGHLLSYMKEIFHINMRLGTLQRIG